MGIGPDCRCRRGNRAPTRLYLGGRIATTGAKSGCCDLRGRPAAPTATGSASKTYRPAGRFPVLKPGSGPLLIIAPHPGRPSAGALALYASACPPVRYFSEFRWPRKRKNRSFKFFLSQFPLLWYRVSQRKQERHHVRRQTAEKAARCWRLTVSFHQSAKGAGALRAISCCRRRSCDPCH